MTPVAPPAHDIQGNILRGYTLEHAAHLFVSVADGAGAQARALLSDLLPRVTTAAPWPRAGRPDATLNVAFTYPGLAALAPGQALLDALAPEFRAGMAARAEALLGDTGPSGPGQWEPELEDAAILLTLYAGSPAARDGDAEALAAEVTGHPGLRVPYLQRTDADRDAREHFGFRDGFSQPAVEGSGRPARGEGVRGRLGWRPIRLGEFILGHRDEDGILAGAPSAFLRNGSYMVWRKLAQDADRFDRWLLDAAGGDRDAAELLAWQVVGRRRDGTSLMCPAPVGPGPADPDNGFTYAEDPRGLRCPLGAHVRRANPRDALGWRTERTKRHRIIRRGMAYGGGAGQEAGLVFVCLNASIERQFEFIQGKWLGDGGAFGLGDDRDLLLGGDDPEAKMTIQGNPPRFLTPGQRFVTTRGGHYLFVPGMAALGRLATPAP
jgi:Dyp-type peroxidase family